MSKLTAKIRVVTCDPATVRLALDKRSPKWFCGKLILVFIIIFEFTIAIHRKIHNEEEQVECHAIYQALFDLSEQFLDMTELQSCTIISCLSYDITIEWCKIHDMALQRSHTIGNNFYDNAKLQNCRVSILCLFNSASIYYLMQRKIRVVILAGWNSTIWSEGTAP